MDTPEDVTGSRLGNTCANCTTAEYLRPLNTYLDVNSKTVHVSVALKVIYDIPIFKNENLKTPDEFWHLCAECMDALSQLYELYLRFTELGQKGSRIYLASVKEEPIPAVLDDERLKRRILRIKRENSSLRMTRASATTIEEVDSISTPEEKFKEEIDIELLDNDDEWVPSPSSPFESAPSPIPIKRGRGRPKLNKPRKRKSSNRKRGRPKSKIVQTQREVNEKRKRGRPKIIVALADVESLPVLSEDKIPEVCPETSDKVGNNIESLEHSEPYKRNCSKSNNQNKIRKPRESKEFYENLMSKLNIKRTDSKIYECLECGKTAKSYCNILVHVRGKHQGLRPHKCIQCGKRFQQADALKNHIHAVHEKDEDGRSKKFVCPVPGCGRSYLYRAALHIHRYSHDRKLSPHVCNICQKISRTTTELKNHMTVHSQDRPVVCDQCGATFKTDVTLFKHKRYTHPDGTIPISTLRCPVCFKVFTTPHTRKQHIRTVHENFKPHQCELCGKEFSCSSNLKVHLKGFHRQYIENSKSHICELCGKEFSTSGNLKVHLRGFHKQNIEKRTRM